MNPTLHSEGVINRRPQEGGRQVEDKNFQLSKNLAIIGWLEYEQGTKTKILDIFTPQWVSDPPFKYHFKCLIFYSQSPIKKSGNI